MFAGTKWWSAGSDMGALGRVRQWLALAVLAIGLLTLSGCSWRLWPAEDDASDTLVLRPIPDPSGPPDASVPVPDGAVRCERDEDCDDGVSCTVDVCRDPGGYCQHAPDFSRCSDDVFCNGVEICDPVEGCLPGVAETCDDGDVCTIDVCDEAAKMCRREPRDFDRDGEVDWHCMGTDCDDFDADRGSDLPEVCGDLIDNDCDDLTDEATCGQLAHDTCADAFEVEGPGTYSISLLGATRDYTLACNEATTRDAVFTFELDQTRAVDLRARGVRGDGNEESVSMALRTDCAEIDEDVECRVGFPAAYIRQRALPAGRYYAIVDSPRAQEVILTMELSDPFEAPENTSCEGALDVSDGGRFAGSFVDVEDVAITPCGPSGQPPTAGFPVPPQVDLLYQFTIDELSDVQLSAVSLTDEPLGLSVRNSCEGATTFLACRYAAPAFTRLHELPPGTYTVVLESPSYREVDFELDVRFLPPTPPPAGDECSDPVPLALGEPVQAELTGRQDRIATSCQAFAPDLVYSLTLEAATDLDVRLDGGRNRVGMALQTACGDPDQELSCLQGAALQGRVRNVQPGEYFLVVESARASTLELLVDALPVTVPEPIGGNGTCFAAFEVPETGGLYAGDTSDFINDYDVCANSESSDAVFKLVLTEPRVVTVRTEASFDTVLYRYIDDGSGPVSCNDVVNFITCNDDNVGNNAGLESEFLDPGTYYYVIDGYGDFNSGPYVIEFLTQ